MKNKLATAISLVMIIGLSFYLDACSGKKSGEKIPAVVSEEVPDSTYIFNGKDLSGWEISDFGPQGPVYVSGGVITLGMGEGCTGITYNKPFPVLDYKVCLEAKKVVGNDFFLRYDFPCG